VAVLPWDAGARDGCPDGFHGSVGVIGIGDGAGGDDDADESADGAASTGRFESLIRIKRPEVAHDRDVLCRGTVVMLQMQQALLFYAQLQVGFAHRSPMPRWRWVGLRANPTYADSGHVVIEASKASASSCVRARIRRGAKLRSFA